MARIGAIVDGDALLQTVWVSVVAGLGVTVSFSLVIVGFVRSGEARQQGNAVGSALYGLLGTAGLLVTAALIVLGLIAMADKD